MHRFHNLNSVKRLKELAEEAVDLTLEGVLNARRIETMTSHALGLKLMFATERVSEIILHALFDFAEERNVLGLMQKMQAGEVLNFIEGYPSEKRAVLHTAIRDFFDTPNPSPAAHEAAKQAYQELEKLKRFLVSIDQKGQFSDLIQIGIGGSELGPKAIYLALEAFQKPGRRIHFLSNIDPDEAASILHNLDLSKTLVVNVSKSGTTLETLTNEALVVHAFRRANLDIKKHIVAVTSKNSPMDNPDKYLEVFYIWDYIGGRYSVTSMVGGVVLAFALGMDRFLEFLRGASAMDKLALQSDFRQNLPLLSALLGIWNRNFLGHSSVAIIPYSQALSRFAAHLQQLDMESNGKTVDKHGVYVDYDTGPIIWGEVGTNCQHSFFQSLHQGTTIVPIEFIGFQENQRHQDLMFKETTSQQKLLSNLFAQSLALAVGQTSDNPNKVFFGNRPNRILMADRLDAYTMGAILSYYEHKVTFQGFLLDINSFDQEGVQLGKQTAGKFLELFTSINHKQPIDPKTFTIGQAYLKLLGHM